MSTRPMPNPYLRVSDAERQEVVDLLKQHASDGRLDTAEFEARLDRTLRAKTRADLAGLLDDLPDLYPPRDGRGSGQYDPGPYGPGTHGPGAYGPGAYGPGAYGPAPYGRRRPPRPFFSRLLVVGLVIAAFFVTLSVISSVARPHFGWLILLIVAAALWHRGHGCRRRQV